MKTITERVAAGAALLDEQRPGWWQRIDLNTLALSSTCNRAELWKRTAETRRIDNLNLRAENDRLRADLALAVRARTRLVECGHEATLRRYDALLEQCRAEHVDRDELERRVGAAARAERWPF